MTENPGLPPSLRPETMRGAAGHYRVGQATDGRWWLVDPSGQPVFLRAVNEVRGLEGSAFDPVARLRSWQFNALGAGSDLALAEEGLPFVATIDFAAAGATVHSGRVRLPDVFDPEWAKAARRHAGEVCLPHSGRRDLVGWLSDGSLGWAQSDGGGQPSLLQVCLSLEPSFAAYHAAWEFVLALHRNRLDVMARSWGEPIANKEVIRTLTREERGLHSRGYLRDEARWTREFARRYFSLTSAAIRAHDPHHLRFGCRLGGAPGVSVLAECSPADVDVPWIDFDDVALVPPGPVMAGEFSWVDERFFAAPAPRTGRGLTSVERMLRRGRTALERVARHPAVIGYSWRQWRDGAGEQPPFAHGLVHVRDAEAREHTELLADINARADRLRSTPALQPIA